MLPVDMTRSFSDDTATWYVLLVLCFHIMALMGQNQSMFNRVRRVAAPGVKLLSTIAGIAAGVCRAFSRVCLFVCALTGKRLELSTPNLIHILHSSCSACIDPKLKRSKVKVTRLQKPSRSQGCQWPWPVFRIPIRGSACRYDCMCFLDIPAKAREYVFTGVGLSVCVCVPSLVLIAWAVFL